MGSNTGDSSSARRKEIVEGLNAGEIHVVVATLSLLSEGFDCRALAFCFLASPIRFSGRVIQAVGRVLRPSPGKRGAAIFDYIDIRVPVLEVSAKSRLWTYKQAGFDTGVENEKDR